MILAVTGGKGGVGKSTVSLNLAAELDAVLVDADLGMADLPQGHGPDLHDVLAGRATVTEAVCALDSFAIVPCGRTLAGARAADVGRLRDVLTRLERRHGAVVVDSPAGLGADVGLPLLAASACLLVTRLREPALTAALRVRELARALSAPLARVVLNRADVVADGLADVLGAPVTPVPESPALASAQRSGVPVARVAPDCPTARRFASLGADLHSLLSAT